jgi:hypothetical protein
MKHLKTLEIYACNMHVYATYRQNTCYIPLKQMNHLEHTLETYVYRRYNMVKGPNMARGGE